MLKNCWNVKVSEGKLLMYKQTTTKLTTKTKWQQYFQERFDIKEGGGKLSKWGKYYMLEFSLVSVASGHTSSLFRKLRLNACCRILKHIPTGIYFKTPFLLITSANFLCLSESRRIHFLEHFYAIYKSRLVLSQGLYSL